MSLRVAQKKFGGNVLKVMNGRPKLDRVFVVAAVPNAPNRKEKLKEETEWDTDMNPLYWIKPVKGVHIIKAILFLLKYRSPTQYY